MQLFLPTFQILNLFPFVEKYIWVLLFLTGLPLLSGRYSTANMSIIFSAVWRIFFLFLQAMDQIKCIV